jgi:hypothetical protein
MIRIVIGFASMKSPIQFRKGIRVALTALCLISTPLAADEILLNSDFSKETDNWTGDFSNDPDLDNPLQPRPSGQISIDLSDRHAVRIFQAFNAADNNLVCNVSFTLSKGGAYTGNAKVSDVASDVSVNPIAGANYNANAGVIILHRNKDYAAYNSSFGTPVLIMGDPDDSKVLLYPLGTQSQAGPMSKRQRREMARATPANDAAGTSYTVHMSVTPHRSYRLYLAFPPGTGTITVTKISLQPDTGE